jgi:2-keto-3-deoxy-L-rhamnonate aldolase RhmA
MMKESLKDKIRNKKLTFGSWISISSPIVAEVMAQSGFDWLVIDIEHSVISISQVQNLIQIIELSGVTPLVRISENNSTLIKRCMDAGSHGIIVPMVNSKDDAIKAVNSIKYPPIGKRGVGLARAQKYGFGFEEYKKWVEKESIVIVQIEHIDAVNNFESIMAVDGVDGFIIGPYDLSASIGKPGDFECSEVKEALHQVEYLSKKLNIASGFHVINPSLDIIKSKINEGYTFIAISIDTIFLGNSCRDIIKGVKNVKNN